MKFWISIFLFFTVCAFAEYPNFNDNPLLTSEMREKMRPYLLPIDHSLKPIIDEIFSQSRVTKDKQSLLHAGFSIIAEMPRSLTFVTKHPRVPGYVFKIHLDSQIEGRYGTPSWEWLVRRCQGAKRIRKIIHKHHIRHFIVPDKWLYILPLSAHRNSKTSQPVVLIATEIALQNHKDSTIAWKKFATKEHLDELHLILKPGLASLRLDENIPYTKDGIFAFTDTEKPIRSYKLKKAAKYFSKKMQKYWLSII